MVMPIEFTRRVHRRGCSQPIAKTALSNVDRGIMDLKLSICGASTCFQASQCNPDLSGLYIYLLHIPRTEGSRLPLPSWRGSIVALKGASREHGEAPSKHEGAALLQGI